MADDLPSDQSVKSAGAVNVGVQRILRELLAQVEGAQSDKEADVYQLFADRFRAEADRCRGTAAEMAAVGKPSGDHQHPPAGPAPASTAEQLSGLQGLYSKDIRFEGGGGGSVDSAQLQKLVRAMVPHVKGCADAELECTLVTGGITNQLYRVAVPAEKGCPLLVRVFGAEGMIDRDLENATYLALSEAGLAPPYFGRFGNGRIEGWLPTRALNLDDMSDPSIFGRVAEQMGRLHKFEPPPGLKEHYAEPGLWPQLLAWLEQSRGSVRKLSEGAFGETVARRTRALEHDLLGAGLSRAAEEVSALKAAIPTDCPVAFCHNDALAGNILKDPVSGDVRLIDFEYGGTNFRGFDIANHWNEWAGGTQLEMNGVPEYGRFPTQKQRRQFCEAYLTAAFGKASEAEILALESESLTFVLVNHWYWGLWAVNRAAEEGIDEFDYITYARHRLSRYYADKEQFGSAQ
eukprot:TRINITY_DN44489_c0_g1_i1.p1 TRINITY_DN44489_c0_g1~~TRINITY_DN44489_c0_g1_i1.p1  ORF type:complete len:461 (+),score=171.87 TRINITY_DN44489_c0_g1_i1:70-1452(+)